ncbi:unnamed protein product, partial [Arabidopsis halleri]
FFFLIREDKTGTVLFAGQIFDPAFGSSGGDFSRSSPPALGASNTPAFGASSTPSFDFGFSQALGQSTPTFGSSFFGSTQSPFGSQGDQAWTRLYGWGSRVMPYAPTTEAEWPWSSGNQPDDGRLQSIYAMPAYQPKNQEELRWEDYQRGDKGGQLPAGDAGFGTYSQPSIFSTATNSFSPSFSQHTSPSMFGSAASNITSVFGSAPSFATNTYWQP